ncbi:hypothetical protein CKF54_06045 [Psittacicella hinzii]|uniref:DNA 3'-5' helicase n=1 Tax=Psittacicella hinzii TaxID=2028575 RepID=A0A3A1Y317_9GAMM|nr:ATP-dependent helicase [Psittacicella hinzii]RIY31820.1 hypothetical protein CKF54_06045 [Psittacicella hinzii]
MRTKLNPQQESFVLSPLENALVLAGAGTGKTSSFIARIAHLIVKGDIDLHSFFATTFTNTAANEMRSRLLSQLREFDPYFTEMQLRQSYIGTFHSLFGRILRNNIERLNNDISPNFTNLEEATARARIREYLKNYKLDAYFKAKNFNERKLLDLINILRENYLFENEINPQDYSKAIKPFITQFLSEEDDEITSTSIDLGYEEFKKVYDYYQQYKINNNMVDFTDYLVKTYKLLKENPDLLEQYQRRFNYLIVDECQDINTIQYKLIELLHNPNFNRVAMIGDDDQSIYGFRGSRVELINQFQTQFPAVKTYKLEANYRSSNNILQLANLIINKHKHENIKVLYAAKKESTNTPVKFFFMQGSSSKWQAEAIAVDLLRHLEYNDSAIIARSNNSLKKIEQVLLSYNIPYEFKTSLDFFSRFEIKLVLNILLLVNNPTANEAFIYLVDNLVDKVGPTVVNKIRDISLANNSTPLFQTADLFINSLWKSEAMAKKNLQEFINRIKSLTYTALTADLEDLIREIYQTFALEDWLKAKKDNYEAREENLDSLLTLAKNFVPQIFEDQETEETDLNHLRLLHNSQLTDAQVRNLYSQHKFLQQHYLDQASLNGFTREEQEKQAVTLTTVHRAKGLEWKHVYIPDFTNETMPSSLSTSEEEIAEERRIFYVAVTRAKEYLYLFQPQYLESFKGFEASETSIYANDFLIKEMQPHLNFYMQRKDNLRAFNLIDFSHGITDLIPKPSDQVPFDFSNSKVSYKSSGGLASNTNISFGANRNRTPTISSYSSSPKVNPPTSFASGATNKAGYNPENNGQAQDATSQALTRLASLSALDLPVVRSNLSAFSQLVKAYGLTYPQQIMFFQEADLELHPQLKGLTEQFAREVAQSQNLSLGNLIYACNFAKLDNANDVMRIAKFFKTVDKLIRFTSKFTTGVDFAQALEKYNVPTELAISIYQVFSQEKNQELVLQLIDAQVAMQTLQAEDTAVALKRASIGIVDELKNQLRQKRKQLQADNPFANLASDKEVLPETIADFDADISLRQQNDNLYVQKFQRQEIESEIDRLFNNQPPTVAEVDLTNLQYYRVGIIGRHSYLTQEEVLAELRQHNIKLCEQTIEADVVFVFHCENNFEQMLYQEVQNLNIRVLSENDFNQIFN